MAKKKQVELTIEEKLQNALVPKEEQPYKIPNNWCWTRLENIAEWGSGGTPSRKRKEYYNGKIPWIKTGELNNGYIFNSEEKITELGLKNSSAKLYPINTVIIAMYGATIGKVGILSIEATTNQACACAVVFKNIKYKYIFYYLISQKEVFINKSKGGAQPNLSQNIIKNHEIPLPPINEQQRIVNRIESLFTKLDKAKELIENTLAQFEQNKMAILHKAFTGELTVKWRKENNISKNNIEESNVQKLYELPKNWQWVKLNQITKIVSGGTPSTSKNEYYIDGDIPWITPADLSNYKEMYIKKGRKMINKLGLEKSSARLMPKNTVCLTTRAPIGYVVIAKNDISTNQGFKSFLPSEKYIPEYLYWYLKGNKNLLESKASGTTFLELSAKKAGEIEFPLAPIEEQQEIVNILDKLLTKYNKIKDLEKQLEQIELLKKAILAKAFRGELGTNNPDEESAEVLLKEILAEK